jgi:hypothetical protein
VNTVIEASIFSRIFQSGGIPAMLVGGIVSASILSAALAYCFRGTGQPEPPQHTTGRWMWRILLAIAAFPVIYFAFGMCVGPFVAPHYNGSGPIGLVIPPFSTIIQTQLIRSPLFLIASLPALLLWSGSRARLILALGLAHAVTVGLYALLQAAWMPMILRVLHSIEITADSFVYALVLVLVFRSKAGHMVPSGYPEYGRAAVSTQGR